MHIAVPAVVDSIQAGTAGVVQPLQVDSTGFAGNIVGAVAGHQEEDTDQLSGCRRTSCQWWT